MKRNLGVISCIIGVLIIILSPSLGRSLAQDALKPSMELNEYLVYFEASIVSYRIVGILLAIFGGALLLRKK